MAQTYDDYFDAHQDECDVIIAWLDDIPDELDIGDFIGTQSKEEFANDVIYAAYESDAGDYADYKYDQMRDDGLLGD